jgi:phage terminase small subunit
VPVLKDPKKERLAAGIAQGLSIRAAAAEAGYSVRMVASRSSALARRADVQARIKELQPHFAPSAETVLAQDMAALRPGELRTKIINELWEVAQDAKAAHDRRVVVSALAEISALTGLKTTKVEVSSSPLDALTPAQLLTLLDVLGGMEEDGQLEIEGEVVEGEAAAG